MSRPGGPSLPWLCLVTDHTVCDGGYVGLERAVEAAIRGGVNVVQLREPGLPARELFELGRRLRRLTAERGAALFVNDRVDVALAIGADGAHLRGDSLPVETARKLVPDLLLGRSVHGLPEAIEAERQGADYVLLGTIFPSDSHPGQPVSGPHLIRKVRARVQVPIIAIGGITPENAAQAIASGASGVAVIRSVLTGSSPEQAARRLGESVGGAWPSAILHRGV